MKRYRCLVVALTVLAATAIVVVPASAQKPVPPKAGQALELQGKIVKTSPDLLVVETKDNKEVKVKVHPKTRFLLKDRPVTIEEIKVGTPINITYVTEADVFVANTVTVVEAIPTADATAFEGEIIRVV